MAGEELLEVQDDRKEEEEEEEEEEAEDGDGNGDGDGGDADVKQQQQQEQAAMKMNLCDGCGILASKYKCPACGFRSCSLPCVRAHKLKTSCSGKRDRTSFLPISAFDDARLLSDYYLLEEMLTHTDSAKRFRAQFERARHDLTPRWATLKNQARRRRIELVYLPEGMSKRIENSSRYCKKRKCIFWRVEWRFLPTEIRLVNPSAGENEVIGNTLQKQLTANDGFNAEALSQARKLCKSSTENMCFFVAKEGVHNNGYIKLDPNQAFGSQLVSMKIIEYPTILVASSTSNNADLVIVEDRSVSGLHSCKDSVPEGSTYKEEEVEEGEIIEEGELN